MNIKIVSAIVATAALMGGSALAGNEGKSAEQKFSEIDTNADGMLSQEEFVSHKTAKGDVTQAEAEQKFEQVAGSDDQLTQQEFEVAMADSEKDPNSPY